MQPKTKGRGDQRTQGLRRLAESMRSVQGSWEPWAGCERGKGRAGPALGQEDRVENEPGEGGETGGRGREGRLRGGSGAEDEASEGRGSVDGKWAVRQEVRALH